MSYIQSYGIIANKAVGLIGMSLDLRSQYTDPTTFAKRNFTSVGEALAYLVVPNDQASQDELRKGHFPVYITSGGITKVYSWPNEGHYLDNDFVEIATLSTRTYTFVLGYGGGVTTGVNVTNQLTVEKTGAPAKAFINAKNGPVGADLIIDIKVNGTSIWANTPSNRLKIVAGATSGVATTFDASVINAGTVLTIDVVQVGSTTPGSTVTVQFIINQ